MLMDPTDLANNLVRIEEIEKASLRLVVQAIYDYRSLAASIFRAEVDLVADIGEDITREALDKMGSSRVDRRLFGKIDYKRARYVFHPDYAVKQALFVDSKAEQASAKGTATLQTSQVSMRMKLRRNDEELDVAGGLAPILAVGDERYVTTTVFVKYNYIQLQPGNKELKDISVFALPNGLLQDRYNPTVDDTIWRVGRDAPTLGEAFRVRLKLASLKAKANWRVQTIPIGEGQFHWDDDPASE